jgi:hypothetical protein
MRICQARNCILRAIPRDIATMSDLFRLPRRRPLAQTYSSGVWISSITLITGKLMRPGKVFGRLWIEMARSHFGHYALHVEPPAKPVSVLIDDMCCMSLSAALHQATVGSLHLAPPDLKPLEGELTALRDWLGDRARTHKAGWHRQRPRVRRLERRCRKCVSACNFDPVVEWAPWAGRLDQQELTIEPGFRRMEAHGQ